jgi:hypothetical protein
VSLQALSIPTRRRATAVRNPARSVVDFTAARWAARGRDALAGALVSTRLGKRFASGDLTDTQRRRLVGSLIRDARADLDALARRLDEGSISLAAWHRKSAELLATGHHAAAMAALGRSGLGPAERADVHETLRRELGFLARFRGEVEAGVAGSPDQVAARARMYGSALWAGGENARRGEAIREGVGFERRLLGTPEQSCSVCPDLAARGWVAVGTLPAIGDTPCRTNCRCQFAYRKELPGTGEVVVPPPVVPPPAVKPGPSDEEEARRKAERERKKAEAEVERLRKLAEEEARRKAAADPVAARRERVRARLANRDAELAAMDAEVARLNLAKSFQPPGSDARNAARRAWLAAMDRKAELLKELDRLAHWEVLSKDNPRLIPAAPIQERIKEYMAGEGGEKVRKLAAEGQRFRDLSARLGAIEDEQAKIMEEVRARNFQVDDATRSRMQELGQLALDIRKDRRAEMARIAGAVAETLKADRPLAIRPVLGPVDADGDKLVAPSDRLKGQVEEARSWLSRIVERAGADPELAVNVGMFPAGGRAYAAKAGTVVAMADADETWVAIHEFGHVLDERLLSGSRKAVATSVEFLRYRVGDEEAKEMNKVIPGSNYRDGEMGREDKFAAALGDRNRAFYAGKDYGERATELLSMGLDTLYRDPTGFAQRDPEFAGYVLGILDGSLR